jgi:hypothetical protein
MGNYAGDEELFTYHALIRELKGRLQGSYPMSLMLYAMNVLPFYVCGPIYTYTTLLLFGSLRRV